LVALNLTPEPRLDWHIVTGTKKYRKEIFNSDSKKYWGSGDVYNPTIRTEVVNEDENIYKVIVNLPPLGAIILK